MGAQAEAGAGAVLVVTAEGRVHSASRGFGELWGLDHDALVARPAAVVFGALAARTSDPADFLERNVRLGETSGDPERAELTLTDGRTLEQASAPIRGEDGTPYGRVWAYRDLTQQRRLANAHAELLLEQAARAAASQRSARLRALHEAALTMHAVMEAEPGSIVVLLAEIMRRAVAALDGRDGRIVLTEDAAWRDLTPGSGPAEGLILLDHTGLLRRRPVRPGGSTEHVLRTGEVVQIHDTLSPQEPFGPYPQLARHGIRSLVHVPLRIAGRVIGAFSVAFVRARELRPADRETMDLFAGHAAAALERARLLHAERRRAQQAERLAATLGGVAAAPHLVSGLEALLRGAISLLGGEDGVARLHGPGPGERLLELNIKEDGRLRTRVNPPPLPPETFSARLQAGGPSVLVTDFLELDPATYAGYEVMKQLGMRSAVLVPIDASSGRIGSLAVNHHLPGYFGPADLALAEALAAQAAAVIERARLDDERQAAVRARGAALEELSRQTEELARRDAEAAALRELDVMKNELLSTMSHELRTPLTVVHGYAQYLQANARDFDAATVERMATLIFSNSRQLVRLVQDMMDFARLGGGELHVQPEPYDLVPQLQELLFAFAQQSGGERLRPDLPSALPVYADGARVEQIVSNLLDNALKYAPQGPITLRARALDGQDGQDGQGGAVRVEVQDEGPGIPPQEQPRVWEKLYRGSGVAGLNVVRGCGIGLAVVKALVEAQGGRVGLQSESGRGSRFWVDLPSRPHAPPSML
jgi:signal transduction histidine kinase